MAICPNCGKKSLSPILRSKPFLIVKESFTNNEFEQDLLFTLSGKNKYGYDENTTSYYLMKELGMAGVSMQTISLSALWLHTPPKVKKTTKEGREQFQKCLDWSISEVVKIAQGKKIVMLMGAEVVKTFIMKSVSDVAGLVCKSDLLPSVNVIIPAPNPDNIMKQPIGELRFSIKSFAEQIKIHEEYTRI